MEINSDILETMYTTRNKTKNEQSLEGKMSRQSRINLVVGIILILIGVLVLGSRLIPGFDGLINIEFSWPLIVIGVGILLFFLGLLIGAPGMSVPACIVGGIGCILYWQNMTDNWSSWAYVWTLIPGFLGIGIILEGALTGEWRKALREGLNLILVSVFLFVIFWLFLGGSGLGWEYWPILLIIFGIWILVGLIFRRRRIE